MASRDILQWMVLVAVTISLACGAQFGQGTDISAGGASKEGSCPDIVDDGECLFRSKLDHGCLTDSDCAGDMKCCSKDCTLKCVPPVLADKSKQIKCAVPVDLAFLIDASGSIPAKKFVEIQRFVKQIVDAFEISNSKTHVSAIWYSDTAQVAFNFNTLKGGNVTKENVFKLIDSIAKTGGKTRIDKALRLAASDVFSVKGGARPGKPKILLVMTDGRQTREPDVSDAEDLHVASKPLKENGVQVYSLGIGQDYDIGELLDIASDDASVFRAGQIDELKSIVADITGQTCKGCTQDVDIHFAIDSSNKFSAQDYDLLRNFLKATIDTFVVSSRGAHFSVSVFGDDPKMVFDFHTGSVKEQVHNNIEKLPHLGEGESNMDKAARHASTAAFSLNGGTRQGSPKVFVLITAGNCASCKEKLSDAVQPLLNDGVQILTIAIGDKVDKREVIDISSKPADKNVYFVSSAEGLLNSTLIQSISISACQGHSGVCPIVKRPASCPPEISYKCESDMDCKEDEKCCFDQCGKACVKKYLGCLKPLDIAFALDVSSRISSDDFRLLKEGTVRMIDNFKTGESNSHVGLLTYSSSSRTVFNFARTYSKDKMKSQVNRLAQDSSGEANIESVFSNAKDDLFSLKGRSRRGVPNVLVLVTKGPLKVKDPVRFVKAADQLKLALGGVELINVFIGPKIGSNYEVLEKASSVSESTGKAKFFHFETTSDFVKNSNLLSISSQACSASFRSKCPADSGSSICSQKTNECDQDFDCPGFYKCCINSCKRRLCVAAPNDCRDKIDLMLVLDDSAKVGEKNFLKVRNFAKVLLPLFKVQSDLTHVAAMTYSDRAKMAFGFDFIQGKTAKDVLNTIDSIPYSGGSTSRLDKALELAQTKLLLERPKRNEAKQTIVLFTDGNTDAKSSRLDIASWPLLGSKVRIIAVSVGDAINEKQMEKVVSLPVSDNVFLASNYDDIRKSIDEITGMSCQPAQVIPQPPVKLEKGPDGDPGPKGDPGPPGPLGDKGPKGPLGDTGERGDSGSPGTKGSQGQAGPPGPPGGITKGPDSLYRAVGILVSDSGVNPKFTYVPGAEGPQGPPGKAGIFGARGDKGPDGDVGPKGEVGRVGPYGPQGPRGKDGVDGGRGPAGDAGDKGPPGPQGPVGVPGKVGPQGPFGWKGARGAAGAVGDAGSKGAAGLKGYPGEKGAQGEVGNVGEAGPVGEEGPTGPQGARGTRGKQGSPGKQGDGGADGFSGSTGLPGLAGNKGSAGAPGVRGQPGAKGEPGLGGAEGARGAPGPAGNTGKEGAAGSKGMPGSAGPSGAQGLPGPEGAQGSQGPQGLTGAEGPKGESGQQGGRGGNGAKGEEGEPGLRGAPGPQGADGPTGATGAAGQRGRSGPAGESGQRGRNGDPGRNGAQGVKGEPGEMGNLGRPGQKGGRGLPGRIGDQGAAGPIGQAGAPGQPGKDGKQGPTGPNGKDGSDGSPGAEGQQGFPGPVGPPGAVGDAGLKGKQGAGGKAGRKGATGEPGPMGETGVQGPQGETGLEGESGPQGSPGTSGLQGPSGPTGPEGSAGKDGAKGPKGAAGKDGPPGPQGERGESGLAGPSGLPGRQGRPGEEGDAGEPGARGDRGPDGRSGAPGAQGSSGPTGQRGSSGRRGSKGPSGTRGPKGAQGSNGLPGSPGMQGMTGRPGSSGPRGERGADGPSGAPGFDGIAGEIGQMGPPGLPGRNGGQGLPGPSGPPGDRGRKGGRGDQGEKGDAGRPGAVGPAGPIGIDGEKGKRGTPGEMGEMGQQGPVGSQGPSGPPGPTGPSGPPGPVGPSGKDGKRGPRGDGGEPGDRGPQGTEGAAGKDGKPGNPGVPGQAGAVGAPGPRGPTGNRGPAGMAGRPGFTGQPGPVGAKGYPGLNGRDGSNGKEGPQGRTGPQGPAGAIGDPGSPGGDGSSGTSGLPGVDGRPGEKGNRGSPGAPGNTGDEGKSGLQGFKGKVGETGYVGQSGERGQPGRKGDIGDTGAVGATGDGGADGNAGRKGLKGNQGANGIPGSPGDVGDKGSKGYQGVQGPPGQPGARGKSGSDGLAGRIGPTGAVGLDGAKGNDGTYGAPGEHGKPGSAGQAGPAGPPGPPGEMIPMSAQLAGYLTVGGLQKGPAYGGYQYGYNQYSSKLGSEEEKAINNGVKSIDEFSKLLKRIEETKSFSGTQSDPARSCKDLFMRFPSKETGDYWVDPNEGSSVDKVLVFCNKNTSETCIYPKQPSIEEKGHSGGDKYMWVMQHLLGEIEGVLYAAEIRQIKVLKLFSTRARQTVKYVCKNSHAWSKADGSLVRKTLKFLTDNEKEVHGHSYDTEITPEIVTDGCKVKDGKWHETIFNFDTNNMDVLPILDVATHDIGDGNEQFGLEVGPICFS